MISRVNRKNSIIGVTFVSLLLLPILLNVLGESYYISIASKILIFALVGISLDLIIGQAGLVSFGHAAFFGIGAYVCGVLSHHADNDLLIFFVFSGTDNALLSWPLAIVICTLLGLIIGLISLRTTGVYFIMITLALAQMVYFLIISIPQYGGEDGLGLVSRNKLAGFNLNDDTQFYYVCLFCLICYLISAFKLTHSSVGLIIRGSKFNYRRLIALGVSPLKYQLAIFVFSAAGAGLAGALMANLSQYISPDYLHWSLSGKFLVIVILGGIGSLFGGFYGALLLLGLEEILSSYTEHWHLIIGIILIIMVLTSRQGFYASLTGKKS